MVVLVIYYSFISSIFKAWRQGLLTAGEPDPLLTFPRRGGDGSAGGEENSNSEVAGGAALSSLGEPPVHQSRASIPLESLGRF